MTPLLLLPLLAASLQAPVAPAQNAWAPTSKWVVRFDEDKCAAIRQFGSGGRTLQVDIRTALMEKHWWLNIEAPERPKEITVDAKATVLIGNVVVPDIVNTVSLSTRPGHTIYSLQLSGTPLEQLRNAGAPDLENRAFFLRRSAGRFGSARKDARRLHSGSAGKLGFSHATTGSNGDRAEATQEFNGTRRFG